MDNTLFTNFLPRPRVLGGGIGLLHSSKSPESKEVLFPHAVIPNSPRNAGMRNLIILIKVWVIWLCPILYPDPNPEYSGEELVSEIYLDEVLL